MIISGAGHANPAEEISLLRTMFHHAATGICVFGLDGRFLHVNDAYCRLLAYSPSELLSLSCQQVTLPEDVPVIEHRLQTLLADQAETTHQFEKRCLCKDGSVKWAEVSLSLAWTKGGEPRCFVAVVQDISTRKVAEKRLQFQAQLLDNVRESVVATDLQGRVVYWGKGAERLYGYTRSDALGQPITFIVKPENVAAEEARMKQVREQGFWEGVCEQRRRDGATFWAETRITLVQDEAGQPVGLVGVDRDVTERMQTEISLRKSEKHFRRLMEELPLPVQVFDAAGEIVYANKAWKDLWRTLAGDFADHFDLWQHEQALAELGMSDSIRNAFAGKQTVFADFEFVPKRFGLNGRKRWLRGRAYGLEDEQGALRNVIFIFEDITVNRESAIKLNDASKRLAVLREIDQAILAARSPQAIAEAALSRIRQLVPCQRASVVLIDWEAETGLILAAAAEMQTAVSLPQTLPLSSFVLPPALVQDRKITTISLAAEVDRSRLTKSLWAAGIRAMTAVPLVASEQLIGVLYLGWENPEPAISGEHQDIGYQVAAQIAIAIQQARLLAAEKTRRQEAETLRTVTGAIVSTLDLDQVLTLILQQLRQVLAFDSAAIFLWEEDKFRAVAVLGLLQPEQVVGQTFPGGDPLSHEMRATKKPILIVDAQQDDRFQNWGDTTYVRGWMGVPLLVRGRLIGHMTVDSLQAGAYKPAHASLILPFANQAAQAIENARLYDAAQHHAQELEQMLQQLREAQQRLLQQERLAAVGQLAAGIAHDFNNILAVIVLYAQLLQRTAVLRPGEQQRLQTIVEQSKRATHLIQQILDFSRQSMIEKRPLSLTTYLKEIEKLLQRTLPETIAIFFEYEDQNYMVDADATSLQQLLMNLAVNARDAMPDGGELRLALTKIYTSAPQPMGPVDLPPGDWVLLQVSDTGCGMPQAVQEHIFEPFFTTKPTGEGTGLGLAQAYGIVKQHDGFIFCDSEVDQGATFRVYLPAITQTEADAEADDGITPQGTGEVVLLVEDSDLTRNALLDILHALNYRVITAVNGVEATAILRQNSAVDLVISDVVMPEMGGVALYQWLKRTFPHIKMLLMTGYAMDERMELEAQHIPWIQKPFTVDRLAEKLAKIFE